MLGRFMRALAVAFRPRFEFLQDTLTLADGRARILLRAEGIGVLFGGDFVAWVNGRYVASLLVPTDRRLRFVFVTVLGPFVKRVSVPATLDVQKSVAPVRPRTGTRVQWQAPLGGSRSRANTRDAAPQIDRDRLHAGMPRRS